MRICLFILGAISLYGCSNAPGRPAFGEMPAIPSEISDFKILYAQNCAGCHGAEGKGGAAIALSNPVYLAFANDAVLQNATAKGIPGTAMPAFAQSDGGMLTAAQVDVIVKGIRERWSKPELFRGGDPPPYSSSGSGDAARGTEVYATYCSSCHGAGGRGGEKAGSIVNGSFLALVNDQALRTIVITGRPELGAPDWRNDVPGKPMTAQDVTDVVAWLASRRPTYPGQPFPSTAKAMGEMQ